ncbi:MAG: tetratricopeptide repeat protein [Planctomycetota bacterium]|jgi:hypothetical protein
MTFFRASTPVPVTTLLLGLCLTTGCQMTAPIHVWKPPTVVQPGSICVAVSPIGGEPQVAQQLQAAMDLSRPQTMPNLAVISPNQLEQIGGIQLVAYDGQPSEMASLSAARRAGANYLLAGEVVSQQLSLPEENSKPRAPISFMNKPEATESLSVRWCVYEVESGRRLGEQTVTLTRQEVDKQFPDLAYQNDGSAKVVAASARRSWELVVPTTYAKDVMIDLPWFAPGSSAVRKGNAYARLGQWEMAERTWQDAADAHNWNTAAWNNLAIAAVAREDFSLARDRLRHANWKYWPGDNTPKTLAWIEAQQRQYHAAFNLPPPSSGWSFPDPPTAESLQGAHQALPESNHPVSLDDQPWYTAFPWIPPPGWTWTQWWSQPWVW